MRMRECQHARRRIKRYFSSPLDAISPRISSSLSRRMAARMSFLSSYSLVLRNLKERKKNRGRDTKTVVKLTRLIFRPTQNVNHMNCWCISTEFKQFNANAIQYRFLNATALDEVKYSQLTSTHLPYFYAFCLPQRTGKKKYINAMCVFQ